MLRSIIVPLDGSTFGEHALPYAAAISRRTGASVKLVHVHLPHFPAAALEPLPTYQLQQISVFDRLADEDARRDEVDRCWALADKMTDEGIPTSARVLAGPVAESISAFARETPDSLIVMSSHGRSGFQRVWLGSVADAVVRHSSTPVLLICPQNVETPAPESVYFSRVLIPVDGSPFSTSIIDSVAAIAGGDILDATFFEVAPTPDDAATALAPIWPNGPAAPAVADDFLEELVHELPLPLAGARAKRVIGINPAMAILEEAEMGSYDLIAMATHGRGGARHLLLGSTADKVMRGTEKPILLFRPNAPVRVAAVAPEPAAADVTFEPEVEGSRLLYTA